ncbi:MAG: hypothetical protein GX131_12495 [candidate division WS1 bacterium]|nr:hypothetical protein [candidate division WS1 bacterium]
MARILLIALVLTVSCCWLAAEEMHSVLPAVGAVCISIDSAIEVDGELSEPAWDEAIAASGFTISAVDALAKNQTAFRIVRNADTLYLGVRCVEENMAGLKTNVTMRDGSVWHDDVIELFLDANHDHETYYQFAVNAIATRFDSRSGATTWDAQWDAAATTDEDGWTLEIAIPFASLDDGAPATGDVWGLNVCRERQAGREKELHNWADVQGNFLRPWLFGHIYFAGDSFTMDDAAARDMYAKIEVPTRIYLQDGIALIGPDGLQSRESYQQMLARSFEQAKQLREMHEELAATFREERDAPHADEFAALDESYLNLREMATSEGAVSPFEWAAQTIAISDLTHAMHELRWQVRIALLLREA